MTMTAKFSTAWAMPSRWTFSIPPIAGFVARWIEGAGIIVDPFCGQSLVGTHRNDLATGIDAEKFCLGLLEQRVVADIVLFDPPYSPRQIMESYTSIGLTPTMTDTQNAALYKRVRRPLSDLLKRDGIALSFGWQSLGFGKEWDTLEIMLVQHGSAHNDTICVAQTKPDCLFEKLESSK